MDGLYNFFLTRVKLPKKVGGKEVCMAYIFWTNYDATIKIWCRLVPEKMEPARIESFPE